MKMDDVRQALEEFSSDSTVMLVSDGCKAFLVAGIDTGVNALVILLALAGAVSPWLGWLSGGILFLMFVLEKWRRYTSDRLCKANDALFSRQLKLIESQHAYIKNHMNASPSIQELIKEWEKLR